jgi:serine-type D-Ala-D-Ala carboxypeptidase (penicillin-binding protein 5/6)
MNQKIKKTLLSLLIFTQVSTTFNVYGQNNTDTTPVAYTLPSIEGLPLENNFTTEHINTQTPQVSATAAIVIDATTSHILYEKNIHARRYPASITKIMTALLVLEDPNFALDNRVFFSRNAIYSTPAGSSHIAMNSYETLSTEEALYALMLASANEVSNALAEHVAGDMETFVAKMNSRALELGAVNTNFTNAHGFFDENHYSTAYDMALIMAEAIKHPDFVRIISTRTHHIPPTERQPAERILNNTNRMIFPGQSYHEHIVGSKTGFTNQSRHTLVSYANKDDMHIISVVLYTERGYNFSDTALLVDYAFTLYEEVNFSSKLTQDKYISVVNSSSRNNNVIGTSSLTLQNDLIMTLPSSILDYIIIEENFQAYVYDMIIYGEIVGNVNVMYNDKILLTSNLIAGETISSGSIINNTTYPYAENEVSFFSLFFLLRVLLVLGTLFLLFILAALVVSILQNRKRRKARRKGRKNNYKKRDISKNNYGYK